MRVAEGTLAEIKAATDIVDLISSYLQLQKKGKSFLSLCPFHDDSNPSFDVDPERQRYRCWSCGQHGDVFQFLIEQEKISFMEAAELLAERAGIQFQPAAPDSGNHLSSGDKKHVLAVLTWSRDLFSKVLASPLGKGASEYFENRGFSPKIIESFRLGFCPEGFEFLRDMARRNSVPEELLLKAGLLQKSERGSLYEPFRNRVMFPIHDVLGRVIGFGGRVLDDSKPKYRNSPETSVFQKRRNLFALEQAKKATADGQPLVVVEGYTDVLMAHQAGFCGVVAGLGTALTEGQARLLRRYSTQVVLLYDGDESGKKAVDGAAEVCLAVGLEVRVAWLPQGQDPCDVIRSEGEEGFRRRVEGARDYFDDLFDGADRLSERERATLAAKCLDKVRCVEDLLVRDALTRRVADELSLSESAVRGWLIQRKDGMAERRKQAAQGEVVKRQSPQELAGLALLREALNFTQQAITIVDSLQSTELPTRAQRLIFEAVRTNLEQGGSRKGDDVTLMIEDPEARTLAHLLLADEPVSDDESRERVTASIEYFRRQRAENDLARSRTELNRVLNEDGDEGKRDGVLGDYLDRLRAEVDRRRCGREGVVNEQGTEGGQT